MAEYSQGSNSPADANNRRLLTTHNINRRLHGSQDYDASLTLLNADRSAVASRNETAITQFLVSYSTTSEAASILNKSTRL
jgi:hypothetical protein